ncbi:uncharacterized protein DFL_005216 [Arthrobotrys flagrans]|uniref:Uncharacterized protein n=1 Tax=Arthrobotrys flagrans TaxID=97331 RepID=A0A437A776_ARTFL|nr:hypothetical protein DFL_005216 [Arthrobotrys flagrans]
MPQTAASGRPLTKEDFIVGWICALDVELRAALAVLDEVLPEPPFHRLRGDKNVYKYGRIKNHYVVIACLPAGRPGAESASVVATYLKLTFPNVIERGFGLLVGVGGGAPNLQRGHDIRLGDIVVSRPNNSRSAVVQYDFGKAMQGGGFLEQGNSRLQPPPRILLSTIEKIQSGNPAPFRNNLRDNAHHLGERDHIFQYPQSPDQLFEATCLHNASSQIGTCARCDLTKRVLRPQRRPDHLEIHYGTIASGNQVMKDGVKRDLISAQTGALCFEMEAPGLLLMDAFPCLVIRGISNYADGHKNDNWQAYAALLKPLLVPQTNLHQVVRLALWSLLGKNFEVHIFEKDTILSSSLSLNGSSLPPQEEYNIRVSDKMEETCR